MKLRQSALALILACSAQAALAHHSQAAFDSTKTQTITGTIAEFNWVNPHSSFKVEVTNADGKTEIWSVEMNTPQNLVRSGWKRTTLKKGDKVTAVVRPMRNGQPGGLYLSITLADGTVLDGRGGAAEAATVEEPAR
jgi:hypothetical protein